MYKRLNDIPVYEYRDATVNARCFNTVQLALHRIGESIRFPIPTLKHLDIILEPQAWIVVDRVLNDIPVAAWTGFKTEHRNNLHQPIPCRIQLYHVNAGLILERTLAAMESVLDAQLSHGNKAAANGRSPKVLPFENSTSTKNSTTH
jgi:hypothetical protein